MNHETNWVVSDPRYDADQLNPKLKFAYWEGHRDFAYDLLQFVRPERLVELGSQYGCSLFTFCQAVRDFKLDTEINAVDMWSGDIGAEITGEEVYALVQKTAATYYPEVNLHLFQMCFDDARPNFADNSIDILHIDGGHTFEDVEHDFTTWLPKLKENGIVLFHDVYSPIDQGSCDHWEKTKKEYDCHFDFTHSCGLGILFPKGRYWYDKLEAAGFFKYYKDLYFYRSKYKYTQARFDELKGLYEERYRAIEQQSKMIDERDARIAADERLVAEKDAAIASQTRLIEERDATIASQTKLIDERDARIAADEKLVAEKDAAIANQAKMIDERDARIAADEKLVAEKDAAIANQAKMIDERDARIAADEKLVAEKDAAIESQAKLIDERDRSLAEAHKIAEERLGVVQQQGNIILTLQQQNAEYEAIIKRHWMSRLEFRRKYGEKK
ncbi:class I SAM-dependent methyltransferase [Stomatobaculum longum]|uniref:class I SAM-dependent methyltransferase n=1 Tax=Stomatobaculum longum TaxID=796942 RepID=UPI0028E2D950|nr:class I SAM-dependent methyltransferase [Stomatobaculum longum]